MVGWIELQHPVAHAAIDRFLENLGPGSPSDSADEIFTEAFVAQDLADVSMAARNIESERRQVHRVGHAESMIEGIGIGNKFRRPRVEQRCAFGRLKLLVHVPVSGGSANRFDDKLIQNSTFGHYASPSANPSPPRRSATPCPVSEAFSQPQHEKSACSYRPRSC